MPTKLASAYARLKTSLLGTSALKFRGYGIACPSCKKTIAIDGVELPANAQLSDLRDAVPHKGWQGEVVTCPRCELSVVCGPNDLIFVK